MSRRVAKAIGALPRFCFKAGLVMLMLAGFGVLALRYWFLPGVGQYRDDVVARVSAATGMAFAAESMEGDWQGLRPVLSFRNVRLADKQGEAAGLALQSLQASLSWWALLLGEIRFHEVLLEGPALTLHRSKDGLIRFNGRPLNQQTAEKDGDFVPWLLQQPNLAVVDANLAWKDDLTEAPDLLIRHLDLRIQKSGTRHRIALIARPDAQLAKSLDARAVLTITRPADRWQVEGSVYVGIEQASLQEFRRHFPVPDVVRSASGNARAWFELDDKAPRKVKAIVADLNAVNVTAQWSKETAPLQLATLAGRTEYVTVPGGFEVSSKSLQLRTKDGVTVAPMDFSLMLAEPAGEGQRGALSGNGIDLKVMSALINYFPVGRELREQVARVAPRGRIHDASVSWTGPPSAPRSYVVKARVDGLGLESTEIQPGVEALTGSVEGNEKGGRFTLASPGLTLDMPAVFRAPLRFDQAHGAGSWLRAQQDFTLNLAGITLENPDFAAEFSGSWRTGGKGQGGKPGVAALTADIKRANMARLSDYFPNQIPVTRSWIEKAIPVGRLTAAQVVVKGDLHEFPFVEGAPGEFRIEAKVEDARLRFRDDWPAIDNIRATYRMLGSRITVDAERAMIFQSKVGATRVEIDDVRSWVPMLTLKGSALASAQDAARYLRESPLRDGVGRITRVLSFDGPGKLDLAINIPLSKAYQDGRPAPPGKVRGQFTFNGVTVRPTIGQAVTEVTGALQFTERSVTGPDLTGTAFGQPLAIDISSDETTGILTTLAGRADVTAVNDYLPFRLPAQVSGAADWRGRINVLDGDVTMHFTSALAGVTSRLPHPLSKRENDSLDLGVTFTHLGRSNERIDLTLANVLYGTMSRRFNPESGEASLAGGIFSIGEPVGDRAIPEGLWLVGKSREFDLDQWRAAMATPDWLGGAAASAATATVSPWTGFDLTADRLTVYGRDLAQANVKGRRAGEDWRVTLASNEVAGDATWRPGAADGRGFVRARLTNLVLNRETPRAPQSGESPQPRANVPDIEYPALDITADKFTFHGYTLGKMQLRADHAGRDWKIDQLKIEADGATLDASGRWKRDGASRSEFQGKLDAKNLNGLLRIFGQGESIRRGAGQAEAALSWPGSPIDFTFTKLSGDLKVEAQRGEFAKIEPGAARLLGLISLQSIPRRITLDFRDLFSDGFAFNRMGGNFRIESGVMRTTNYEIAGPSAFVTMQGEISLPNETQSLKLTVIPSLGEGVSIITTLIGGPVVGLTTLLAQKLLQDPVGRALGYEYNVTGKWDNPDVARVGSQPPATPPAPSKAAPRASNLATQS
ncbi:MAG: TIGR02099 family protein [Betaproteobacteria bacterium]|nr:TIGR02099 family protein [Betaproteobacteria bacterium]